MISKHIVNETRVSYDINWVTRCSQGSRKSSGDDLTSSELDNFLLQLSKTKKQWQVEQAALSIRLYQYFVKSKQRSRRQNCVDDKQQWRFVADEMDYIQISKG